MRWVISVISVFSMITAAVAWETLVEQGKGNAASWRSIYQEGPKNTAAADRKRQIKKPEEFAEHTRLSDLALQELGVYDLFGRGGSASISIVDLSASHFRYEEMDGLPTVGDNPDTILEERLIPTPAYFSGVPDFSYTIYDWLNKNELCPPGDLGKECHVYFLGWLGNLNSAHFGSQSTKMYKRYHTIALNRARDAFLLHQSLRQLGEPALSTYLDHVKELELQALAYEGYAQHFLQDRWSIGHMWERWGAPDYAQLPNKRNKINTLVAMISGLVHGSEAVVGAEFNLSEMAIGIGALSSLIDRDSVKVRLGDYINAADPLSSPRVQDGKAVPMTFRHTSSLAPPIDGVGDDRLTDMNRKAFGKPYFDSDYEIDVRRQKSEMLTCSKAGWAEVIRAFGDFGGYGAWGANLAGNAPTFSILTQESCWDMWATNEAMYQALVADKFIGGDGLVSYSTIARLVVPVRISVKEAALKEQGLRTDPRKDLMRVIYRLSEATRNADDPVKDTTMARGGMGPIFGVDHGGKFNLPDYAEPVNLSDLPKTAKTGRDKDTVLGAFNRAHSDALCKDLPGILAELRDPKDKRKQAACEYLADFAYRGTDRSYTGLQREQRKTGGKVIGSICQIRGQEQRHFAGGEPDELLSERFPAYINQGYVPYGKGKKPEQRSTVGYSSESVANWCARKPVLLLAERETAILAQENSDPVASPEDNELGGDNEALFPPTVDEMEGSVPVADGLTYTDPSDSPGEPDCTGSSCGDLVEDIGSGALPVPGIDVVDTESDRVVQPTGPGTTVPLSYQPPPSEKQLRELNIVAEVPANATSVTLSGRHLGEAPGQVLFGERNKPKRQLGSVKSWRDDEIILALPKGQLEKNIDYELNIIMADGTESVGFFLLRVGPETQTIAVSLDGVGPCREPLPDELPVVDFLESIKRTEQLTKESLEDLLEDAEASRDEINAFLNKEAQCIVDRWELITASFGYEDYLAEDDYPDADVIMPSQEGYLELPEELKATLSEIEDTIAESQAGNENAYADTCLATPDDVPPPEDYGGFFNKEEPDPRTLLPELAEYQNTDFEYKIDDDADFVRAMFPQKEFYLRHHRALVRTAHHMDVLVKVRIPTIINLLQCPGARDVEQIYFEELSAEFEQQYKYFLSLAEGLNLWTRLEARNSEMISTVPPSYIKQALYRGAVDKNLRERVGRAIFALERDDKVVDASELEGAFNRTMKQYQCTALPAGVTLGSFVEDELIKLHSFQSNMGFFTDIKRNFPGPTGDYIGPPEIYSTFHDGYSAYWEYLLPAGRPRIDPAGCEEVDQYLKYINDSWAYGTFFDGAAPPKPAFKTIPYDPQVDGLNRVEDTGIVLNAPG